MSVSVCLSVCLSVCPRSCLRSSSFFLCVLLMTVARSSSSGFMDDVIFARKIKVARRRRPAEAQCTPRLGLGYKLCAVIPAAGQRTHGTTFRALKVTFQVATPGAESAVYDCLV